MTGLPDRETIIDNERFTLSFTPPIFYDHGEQVDGPIATGTFFKIAEHHFLITAWHTFEDFKAESILIIRNRTSDDLISMGKYDVIYPIEKYDVCALEIVDPDALRDLKKNWYSCRYPTSAFRTKTAAFCCSASRRRSATKTLTS